MAEATKRNEKRPRAGKGRDWRPAFLAAFVETGIEVDAARAANVGITTVWREKQSSPEFAAAFEEARQSGALLLVKEATRRARDGVQKLKFSFGQVIMVPDRSQPWPTVPDPCNPGGTMVDPDFRPQMVPYVEHEYSDALLTLLLKRHFPNDFRERSDVNHSGAVGVYVVEAPPLEPETRVDDPPAP